MGSAGPTTHHDADVTVRVTVTRRLAAGDPTRDPKSVARALWPYPVLLLLSLAGALLPFVVSVDLMNVIPRAVVVTWYGFLALAAGVCSIIWIIRAASLAFKAHDEVDIPLAEETQKKILEAISFRST